MKPSKDVGVFMKVQVRESILRIKNPTVKKFSELWKQHQPFVIEDVAKDWDASKKWCHQYLIEQCGNNLVPVRFYHPNFWHNSENYAYEDGYEPKKEIKFHEYINNHIEKTVQENNLECYLSEAYFEDRFPELVRDITYPEYFDRKAFVTFWYGFSSKNFSSTTNLHFDPLHNIFAQIRGRKRILLYPPSDYLSFYPPLDGTSGVGFNSKVNPDLSNLELFPKFPRQDKIEITLQPGEILYIPPFWWHHLTAVDENISLSFWYDLKIEDFFKQKNMLSVFLNIAPHYLYYAISSGKVREFMGFLKTMFH
ncbi:MAG: cupin-like domain-containing protein [Nostoc sp. ChiQUE01a]|nr:cupin-like domain-containing protein [Nostoc sp. ChiQUE01a]